MTAFQIISLMVSMSLSDIIVASSRDNIYNQKSLEIFVLVISLSFFSLLNDKIP